MYFEEFEIGQSWQLESVLIKKEKMMEFARDYDNIPLHTDEEYAKRTIFGALIAPGVMTFMSVWNNFLQMQILGREMIAGKSTKIEWIKPVYANDVLTGCARVSALTERNAKNGIVEITVEAQNQNGVCVLTNVTEIIVKRKPKNN